ncbi:hypothetical protein B0H11DRAFT_2433161, partial [Mycena galericulata]
FLYRPTRQDRRTQSLASALFPPTTLIVRITKICNPLSASAIRSAENDLCLTTFLCSALCLWPGVFLSTFKVSRLQNTWKWIKGHRQRLTDNHLFSVNSQIPLSLRLFNTLFRARHLQRQSFDVHRSQRCGDSCLSHKLSFTLPGAAHGVTYATCSGLLSPESRQTPGVFPRRDPPPRHREQTRPQGAPSPWLVFHDASPRLSPGEPDRQYRPRYPPQDAETAHYPRCALLPPFQRRGGKCVR